MDQVVVRVSGDAGDGVFRVVVRVAHRAHRVVVRAAAAGHRVVDGVGGANAHQIGLQKKKVQSHLKAVLGPLRNVTYSVQGIP